MRRRQDEEDNNEAAAGAAAWPPSALSLAARHDSVRHPQFVRFLWAALAPSETNPASPGRLSGWQGVFLP